MAARAKYGSAASVRGIRRDPGRPGSAQGYATDLIEPVAVAALSEVFGKAIVGVDDTHLKTLDKAGKHGVFRGHIWRFVGSDGVVGEQETVAYGYTRSWEATEISEWFSAIEGIIQCDDYAGYSTEVEDEQTGQTLVAVPPERRLGCGMHIRSKFHDALLANYCSGKRDGRRSTPRAPSWRARLAGSRSDRS